MGAAAPNGEKSILFDKLINATDNINRAETLYNELASEEFKKWFGIKCGRVVSRRVCHFTLTIHQVML